MGAPARSHITTAGQTGAHRLGSASRSPMTGIRFHAAEQQRGSGLASRSNAEHRRLRAAVQRSGDRPDAKPVCGSAAGRAQRGRVGSLHRSSLHHSATGIRLPRARTTARVRSRCAVERRSAASHVYSRVSGSCHGTANEAPSALADGAEARGSEKRASAAKLAGLRGLRQELHSFILLPPPGATAIAFLPPPGAPRMRQSSISSPHTISRRGRKRGGRTRQNPRQFRGLPGDPDVPTGGADGRHP